MYTPARFGGDGRAIAAKAGFGWLVTRAAASPLPFVLDAATGDAIFHCARKNPLAEAVAAGLEATLYVTGPEGYVSHGDYEDPARHVPTWNYEAAALTGALAPEDGRVALAAALAHREALPVAEDVLTGLLGGIVGGRLVVTAATGKRKLSQNRASPDASARVAGGGASPETDASRVAERLWGRGAFAIAAAQRRTFPYLAGDEAITLREIDDPEELPRLFPLVAELRSLDVATFCARVAAARASGYRIVIAEEGPAGAVLGYVGFRALTNLSRGAHAHIDDLVVTAAHRGAGLGARLLRHVEERAATAGLEAVYLDARPTAIGFYEGQGYSMHPAPVYRRATKARP